MNPRRLFLPTPLLLSLLGLGAWAWAVFWPIPDVRVLNRSGQILRGLRVCVHECVERAELTPGRTWRVPLRVRQDGDADLNYDGLRDKRETSVDVTPGLGIHWVVGLNGHIERQQ